MRKIFTLLILLFLVRGAGAAIRYVCPDGDCGDVTYEYSTPAAANTAASTGDTIQFAEGPAAYYVNSVEPKLKTKWIGHANKDTMQYANTIIYCKTDSQSFENFVFKLPDTITGSSIRTLIQIRNGTTTAIGGQTFTNCVFSKGTNSQTINQLYTYSATPHADSINEPITFKRCVIEGIGYWMHNVSGSWDGRYVKRVTYDTCAFNSQNVYVGGRSTLRGCAVSNANAMGGEVRIYEDTANVIDCAFFCDTGEALTLDDSRTVKALTISDIVMDSMKHAPVMIDGAINSTVSGVFVNRKIDMLGAIYNHQSSSYDDSKNIRIIQSTLGDRIYYPSAAGGDADTVIIRKILFLASSAGNNDIENYMDRDTLDSLVSAGALPISQTADRVIDTLRGRASSLTVIDTMLFPFLKQSSTNPAIWSNGAYAGSHKYLSNKYAATNITSSSFAAKCSLSWKFKHDNRIYTGQFWNVNSWFTGDTGKTILQTSTNKSDWTNRDTVTYKAGACSTFTASGLSGGTKIYYRFVTDGLSAGTTGLHDTTYIDSATTLSGGSQPIFRNITRQFFRRRG